MPVLEFDMIKGTWTEGEERTENGCGCVQARCNDGEWIGPVICERHK